jgi:hypothetical protein
VQVALDSVSIRDSAMQMLLLDFVKLGAVFHCGLPCRLMHTSSSQMKQQREQRGHSLCPFRPSLRGSTRILTLLDSWGKTISSKSSEAIYAYLLV